MFVTLCDEDDIWRASQPPRTVPNTANVEPALETVLLHMVTALDNIAANIGSAMTNVVEILRSRPATQRTDATAHPLASAAAAAAGAAASQLTEWYGAGASVSDVTGNALCYFSM